MLNQTENRCKIEGILSEINLEEKTFKKGDKDVNAIGGSIKIRVTQNIKGTPTIFEIPVQMFATEITNKGGLNPAYENISKILKEFTSIAAAGIDLADRVRITNGTIVMNEYYGQNDKLVSFPRINASFVTKIRKDECKEEASFITTFMVGSLGYETDKDGVETDKYKIVGIISQYGGKVDVVPFHCTNKGVIDAVSNYWNAGDTVKASGKLNFTSSTETIKIEVDFGEPQEQTRTITVSELLITGGSSTPLEGEFAMNEEEVNKALEDRKVRLAELKEKSSSKEKKTPTSATASTKNEKFRNLGF